MIPEQDLGFLNQGQQKIMRDIISLSCDYRKIEFVNSNYIQFQTWGKTRLCLFLCLYDLLSVQRNMARPLPVMFAQRRYLVITENDLVTRQWEYEWLKLLKFRARPEENHARFLLACYTSNAIQNWNAFTHPVIVLSKKLAEACLSKLERFSWLCVFVDCASCVCARRLSSNANWTICLKKPPDPPDPQAVAVDHSNRSNCPDNGYGVPTLDDDDTTERNSITYDVTRALSSVWSLSTLLQRTFITNKAIQVRSLARFIKQHPAAAALMARSLTIRAMRAISCNLDSLNGEARQQAGEPTNKEEEPKEEPNEEPCPTTKVTCLVCCEDVRYTVFLKCCKADPLCLQCFLLHMFNNSQSCMFCNCRCLYDLPAEMTNYDTNFKSRQLSVWAALSAANLMSVVKQSLDDNYDGPVLVTMSRVVASKILKSVKNATAHFEEFAGKQVNFQMLRPGFKDWNRSAGLTLFIFDDGRKDFQNVKLHVNNIILVRVDKLADDFIGDDILENLASVHLRGESLTITRVIFE